MIDPNNTNYDFVVVGGTPGGIACAVRAAREGLTVLLVNYSQHLGGFVTSGAGGWETPCDYLRSPLYAEMINGAADYYRGTCGDDSPQYRAALPNPESRAHIERPKVEPRVAEMLFEQMVAREKSLSVLKGYYVLAVEREGALIQAINVVEAHPSDSSVPCELRITARTYADATYEGDLAAAAGAPCQIGREPQSRYHEPHAGVIYSTERTHTSVQMRFPEASVSGDLNLRSFPHATGPLREPESTGEGDDAVMAYNYRLILTKDPENRVPITRPENYDPDAAKKVSNGSYVPGLPNVISDRPNVVPNIPNGKIGWNGGRLIGPQNIWPSADWTTRERIAREYLDTMLSLLWYYQNDPNARECDRDYWKGYGLAADEFIDNENLPYEIYVREARRLIGRYVFTEKDAMPDPALARACHKARTPIHFDSIATTDWPIDSVACLRRSSGEGAHPDGILFLAEESRPAQIPYRTLLPKGLANLLVPVALSASHVGWGPIRLEPVWMQTGEAAGLAAALAFQHGVMPDSLNPDILLHGLVERRVMVSFFNDVDPSSSESWVSAVQYLGTKGFFATYDARPDDDLTLSTARCWVAIFDGLLARFSGAAHCDEEKIGITDVVHTLPTNDHDEDTITLSRFSTMLTERLRVRAMDDEPMRSMVSIMGMSDAQVSRSAACELVYQILVPLLT